MDLQSRTETRLRFLPQEGILYWLMSSIDLDIWNEKVVVNGYTSQVNFTENTHPKFRSNRYECTVVLPNLNYERNDVPQEFHQTGLNAFIGELIRKDRNISTETMAMKLGVSAKTIKRRIKDMKHVHFIGRGSNGHWEIKEELWNGLGQIKFS